MSLRRRSTALLASIALAGLGPAAAAAPAVSAAPAASAARRRILLDVPTATSG